VGPIGKQWEERKIRELMERERRAAPGAEEADTTGRQ
jgi:hypothetical protein